MLLQTAVNQCCDKLLSAKRKILGRRARLYCVGTGKSGTHSVAAMFSGTVRAGHEAEAVELMVRILAFRERRISEAEFVEWLHKRDRRMALEVDSSSVNFDILEILVREFGEARFLLTIRDCYSWCNSLLNHAIRFAGRIHPVWYQMGHVRDQSQHEPEEQLLKENGLRTLAGYFSYWTRHNQEVLERVPEERLLVVRTDHIQQRAFEIADFAELPRRAIRLDRTHEYRNPEKEDILRKIDRNFVEAKVEKHCRALMTRFFPEIKSLDDAKL